MTVLRENFMIETFLSACLFAGLSGREYIPSRIGAAAGAAKRAVSPSLSEASGRRFRWSASFVPALFRRGSEPGGSSLESRRTGRNLKADQHQI
jgi:hypothetical protein